MSEAGSVVTIPSLKLFARGSSEYIPSKAPVFYNPRMALNRDLAVLVLRAYRKMIDWDLSVCEPLTGCGIRGIRFASQVEGVSKIVLNDLNPIASNLATLNVEKNGLTHKIIIENDDANSLLISHSHPNERFDMIDLDPFGSPSPFIDSALLALKGGGLIALTATDTAPLCGVNPLSCIRKYFGRPLRTEYCHELGIRILLNSLVFSASRHELGVNVLFSHSTNHYLRVYAQVRSGAGKANMAVERIGYILHCFDCFHRQCSFGLANFKEARCEVCGGNMNVAGPLWLGQIATREFCESMLSEVESVQLSNTKAAKKLLNTIIMEAEAAPTYYVIDRICDRLNVPPPSTELVIRSLSNYGYIALPTHFHPRGVKTNAPMHIIEKSIKELVLIPSNTLLPK
ncbi:MAG: tRNA (guanine26-N2/guanine27-N2)-dimethyltransferase [Thermoproteota archaeon]|nr:tRNA (guanine26-N2/guanine27-N2)-dimethyltransferase [Thermoproteota archaeon]